MRLRRVRYYAEWVWWDRWVGLRCRSGSGSGWEGVGCVWGGIVYGGLWIWLMVGSGWLE